MSGEIVLALDAMGGDQGPEMVVKGREIVRLKALMFLSKI